MSLLIRTPVLATFYALSVLAIFWANPSAADGFCANPSAADSFCANSAAAEPMMLAQIPGKQYTPAEQCWKDCASAFHGCLYQGGGEVARPKCEPEYNACRNKCPPM